MAGVLRVEPGISFEIPLGVIPDRMSDPDVFDLAATLGRVVVSHDARTMPRHFADFVAHSVSPGLILVPRSMTIAQAIEELVTIWRLTEADEWRNHWRRLPL